MKNIEEYLYTDYISEQLEKCISFHDYIEDVDVNQLKKRKSKLMIFKQIIRIQYKKLFY